ncbi:hypothetical protein [Brevibacillus centrosporus]|uniref:hypothetical protein n=1 Tax=Brevibacillus centrosporus TaxID=54910 RepID=UPI002E1DC6B2|nr:hypothetical protein [Brevibacillus centrosporus]
MTKQITWGQALKRTGFLFEKQGESFFLPYENKQNLQLLERILHRLGVANAWEQMRFTPPSLLVEEAAWMEAFYENRGCREDFPGEVDAILLHSLDPYIAGIVRWCTAIGIPTAMSCDGHGRRHAYLSFERGNEQYPIILDACLSLLSGGKWQFQFQYEGASGRFMLRRSDREMRESLQARREMRESGREHEKNRAVDQSWLLDVAEAMYDHLDVLSDLVRSMKAISAIHFAGKRGDIQ